MNRVGRGSSCLRGGMPLEACWILTFQPTSMTCWNTSGSREACLLVEAHIWRSNGDPLLFFIGNRHTDISSSTLAYWIFTRVNICSISDWVEFNVPWAVIAVIWDAFVIDMGVQLVRAQLGWNFDKINWIIIYLLDYTACGQWISLTSEYNHIEKPCSLFIMIIAPSMQMAKLNFRCVSD